jgi:hypothetical protein
MTGAPESKPKTAWWHKILGTVLTVAAIGLGVTGGVLGGLVGTGLMTSAFVCGGLAYMAFA